MSAAVRQIMRRELTEVEEIRIAVVVGGADDSGAVIRALDEAGFVIVRKGLHQSLRRMVDAFCEPLFPPPRPIGAPNSVARAIQNEKIAAHAEASALAYPTGHLRDE